MVFACNNQQSGSKDGEGFAINGTINGFDSGYVYLHRMGDGRTENVDSMRTQDGKFNFKGKVDFPEMYAISFGDKRHIAMIFLENSNIELVAQYDSLDDIKVKGSKSHDEWSQYEDELSPFDDKIRDLYKQYGEAQKNNDKALMDQLDSTYEPLMAERSKFVENYIVSHNKSAIAPYILKSIYYTMELNELDSIFGLLDSSLEKSKYTQTLKKKIEILKSVAIGKVAPDFTLPDTSGTEVSLKSFRGKYLLVDFWASWCGPCRRENPNNVKLYKKYKNKGFEILGVSLDKKRDNWIKAIKDDGLTWPQVSDLKYWQSEAGKLYGVSSIPYTVLLDKEGVIIAKGLRGEKLDEKVAELIK